MSVNWIVFSLLECEEPWGTGYGLHSAMQKYKFLEMDIGMTCFFEAHFWQSMEYF